MQDANRLALHLFNKNVDSVYYITTEKKVNISKNVILTPREHTKSLGVNCFSKLCFQLLCNKQKNHFVLHSVILPRHL